MNDVVIGNYQAFLKKYFKDQNKIGKYKYTGYIKYPKNNSDSYLNCWVCTINLPHTEDSNSTIELKFYISGQFDVDFDGERVKNEMEVFLNDNSDEFDKRQVKEFVITLCSNHEFTINNA